MPLSVELGDVLELGHGPILMLRIVDLVEASPNAAIAAMVKVSPGPMVVR